MCRKRKRMLIGGLLTFMGVGMLIGHIMPYFSIVIAIILIIAGCYFMFF